MALVEFGSYIDSHVHVMSERRIRSGVSWVAKSGWDTGVDPESATPESLVEEIRADGFEYFFNFFFPIPPTAGRPSPANSREIMEWQHDFCRRTPGAIPFVSVDVNDADYLEVVDTALNRYNFAGFKVHPYTQQVNLTDPRMEPIYEAVAAAGKIFVSHTGFADFYHGPELSDQVAVVIERHPELTFVAAHMLYPYLDKAERWLQEYENFYLDLTNVQGMMKIDEDERRPSFEQYISILERFSDRIMFGSDLPMAIGPHRELLNETLELPISDEAKANILRHTALRLLDKTGWPIATYWQGSMAGQALGDD